METGKVIRLLRKNRGMSQVELSSSSELDRSHLSSMESGKRDVGMFSLEKVADALNLKAHHILFLTQFKEKNIEEALEKLQSLEKDLKKS